MKQQSVRLINSLLLANGTTALLFSVIINSSILALIGLGLVFWGALFLYIEPQKYVQARILHSSTASPLDTLTQLTSALNYNGKAIYLPPRYFPHPGSEKVFINWGQSERLPPLETVNRAEVLMNDPLGLCVTPPGLALTNLYERELGIQFMDIDLYEFQDKISKLMTEDLEIAKTFSLDFESNHITIHVTDHIYQGLCSASRDKKSALCCPLCSSIAVALARTLNTPITVENLKSNRDDSNLVVSYKSIEEAL
jgi:hypothetical protein